MAEYIHHKNLPEDMKIYATGDWHVGSLNFVHEAAQKLISKIKREKKSYWLYLGDCVEGKPVGSKHFDPHTLKRREMSIDDQFAAVQKLWEPITHKLLAANQGNHDRYLCANVDRYAGMMRELGASHLYGGYQTWVELFPDLKIFLWHGRRSMPNGAKDPIQREANQKAWLKRQLENLASDCHIMLKGHVHSLMVQPPIEQTVLVSGGENVKRLNIIEPVAQFGKYSYVPKEARWYGICGTLRRSGGFGFVDYSEVAGFPPVPIGWLEITIKKRQVIDIKKVIYEKTT